MLYESTRGEAPKLGFEGALTAGLAADGGLYVPERWPALPLETPARLAAMPHAEAGFAVMRPFVGDAFSDAELAAVLREACAAFDTPAVAPLRRIGENSWLLELFHGPTLAFKDHALQVVARLLDRALARRGERAVVVGATSGDTGSAAIHACGGRERLDVFILHPRGRVSEVQRRQMTTVTADNVHNIAIDGTFDDCQALAKGLFADAALRRETNLASVNSINWARVMAQTVYYATAAAALASPEGVRFVVPTGNFGDAYAGYAAARMGAPVARILVATNRNDILARCLNGGEYRPAAARPTLSPSMDIQAASNFERLLFDLHDRDGARVGGLMRRLADDGGFVLAPERRARAARLFAAARASDEDTLRAIARVHAETGVVIDPHTAVGVAAAACAGEGGGDDDDARPLVYLATAHPAKFPDAVARAIGHAPAPPPALRGLADMPERYDVMGRDPGALAAYIRAGARTGTRSMA